MGMPVSQLIANLMALAVLIVLAPLTVVLLTLAFAGRRSATRPTCRRCARRLPSEHARARDACPHCGSSLAEADSMRPERRRIAWRTLLLALVVGTLGASVLWAAHSMAMRSAGAFARPMATTPLAQLVTQVMASGRRYDWNVQEIETRLRADAVTPQDLRTELLSAIAAPGFAASEASEVLAGWAFCDGKAPPEFADAILDSAYVVPRLHVERPEGGRPELQISFGLPSPDPYLPTALRGVVRSVRVDGVERHELVGTVLERGNSHTQPLPDGAREVEVTIDLLLASSFDAGRHRGADYRFRPVDDWPKPVARKSITLKASHADAPTPLTDDQP